MEAELSPQTPRAPARSTSLPEVANTLKTPRGLQSLVEDEDEFDLEVPAEALALRSAFVTYCRGHDWRPQTLPGGATSSLSASTSNPGGTTNNAEAALTGCCSNVLYASPSTQSLSGSLPADGAGGLCLGMGLTSWMRLWTDLGLPEGQGGPVPGTLLQTIHAAYRPYNSAKLTYVDFVQACAALSCQLHQNLLGAVGRQGAALQAQQRYQWRQQQLQQQQAHATLTSSFRPSQSSYAAADEDILFESMLELTPQDIAKEIAVLSQLQFQLSQLSQQHQEPPPPPEKPPSQEDAARMSSVLATSLVPPLKGTPWRPREPPPAPQPLTIEPMILSQPTPTCGGPVSARASIHGGGGGGALKLPSTVAAALAGAESPPLVGAKRSGGGGRSPQTHTRGGKPSGGWVRGGTEVASGPPPSSNPYLQGLTRGKYYSPQLRQLRNPALGGEGIDLRPYQDSSPGRGPIRPREPRVGGPARVPAATGGSPAIDDPDPASSPLDGPASRAGPPGDFDDPVAFPITSGTQPVSNPAVAASMGSASLFSGNGRNVAGRSKSRAAGAGGGGSGGEAAAVKLPALNGAKSLDAIVSSASGLTTPSMPTLGLPESLECTGSPAVAVGLTGTFGRQATYFRGTMGGAYAVPGGWGGGGLGDTTGSGGSGAGAVTTVRAAGFAGENGCAGGGTPVVVGRGGEPEGGLAVSVLLARVERLERAAVSAESRLAHVGARVRSLEMTETAASKASVVRPPSEEAMVMVADAAAEAHTRRLGEELAAVFEELDGRQAFLGRQILDQQQRLAEHQRQAADQQQQAAAVLAAALTEVRTAVEAAAAAQREAAAAKAVAAQNAEVAQATSTMAAADVTAAAAEFAAAAAAVQDQATEKSINAIERVGEDILAAARVTVAEEIDKMATKAQLDEQFRALDELRKRLDEQVAALAAKQLEVMEVLTRVVAAEATSAAVAAAEAAAAKAAAAGINMDAAVAAMAAQIEELRVELSAVHQKAQAGVEAAAGVDERLRAAMEEAEAVRDSGERQQGDQLVGLQAAVSALQARVSERMVETLANGSEREEGAFPEKASSGPHEAIEELVVRLDRLEAEVARATAELATATAIERQGAVRIAMDQAGVGGLGVPQVGELGAEGARLKPEAVAAAVVATAELTAAVARLEERLAELQRRVDEQLVVVPLEVQSAGGRGREEAPHQLTSPGTPRTSRPGTATAGGGSDGTPPGCKQARQTSSDHNEAGRGGYGAVTVALSNATFAAAASTVEGGGRKASDGGIRIGNGDGDAADASATQKLLLRLEQLYDENSLRLEQVSARVEELRSHVDEELGSRVGNSTASLELRCSEAHSQIEEVRAELMDLQMRTDGLAVAVTAAAATAAADVVRQNAALGDISIEGSSPAPAAAASTVAVPADGTDGDAPAAVGIPTPPLQIGALATELAALRDRVGALEQTAAIGALPPSAAIAVGAASAAPAIADTATEPAAASLQLPDTPIAHAPSPQDLISAVQRRLDNLTVEVRQSLDLSAAAISRDLETARIELAVMVSKEVAAQVATQVAAARAVQPTVPQVQQRPSLNDGRSGGSASGDMIVVGALQARLTAMESEVANVSSEMADVCRAADMTTESVELLTKHLQMLEQSQLDVIQQLADVRRQLDTGSVVAFAAPAAPIYTDGPRVGELPLGAAVAASDAATVTAAGRTVGTPPGGPAGLDSSVRLPVAPGNAATRPAVKVEADVVAEMAELRAQLSEMQSQNLLARLQAAEAALRTNMDRSSATATSDPTDPPTGAAVTSSPEIGAAAAASSPSASSFKEAKGVPLPASEHAPPSSSAPAAPTPAPSTPPAPALGGVEAAVSLPGELQVLLLELSGQVDSLSGLVREQEHGLDVLAQLAEEASNNSRGAASRLDAVEAALASLKETVRAGGSLTPTVPAAAAEDAGTGDGGTPPPLPPLLASRPSVTSQQSQRHSVTFGMETVLEDMRAAVSEMDGRLAEVEKGLEVRGAAMAALSRQLDEATRRLAALDGRVTDVAMDAAAAKAATKGGGSTAGEPPPPKSVGAGKPMDAAGSGEKYEESPDSYGSMDVPVASGGGGGAHMHVEELDQEWQARLKAVVKLLEGKVQAVGEKAAADQSELKREVGRLREKSVVIDEVILKLARRLDSLFKKVQDLLDSEEAETMTAYSVIDRERLGSGGGGLRANSSRRMARQLTRQGSDSQDSDYQAGLDTLLDAPASQVVSRSSSMRGK